jgi:cytochrome c-type biogenesis protein CcmH
MTPVIYAAGAALTLLALALTVVPLLRHRKESGVGLSLVAVILIFPLAVAGLYVTASSFPWDDEGIAVDGGARTDQPPVGEMITDLEARLEKQPDVEGYVLLARSYMSLQRFPDAVDAWHKAWELTEGAAPEISLQYAEALILADRRTLKTGAVDLLEAAITELPNDPRALWYGGLSAAARGQNDIAVERFSRLLQTELPAEFRSVVQEQLANLGAAPAFANESNAAASGAAGEEGSGIVVEATVELDPALADLVPPNATLFVFAQDAKRPGPPIAAKRLSAATFPLTVVLTDADVMIKGNSLGRASQLKIAARISVSGNPIAAPGDLYGEIIPAIPAGNTIDVSLIIDSVEE